MCCDTISGLQVIERLIRIWKGSVLLVWLKQIPSKTTFDNLELLRYHIRSVCEGKGKLCVPFISSDEAVTAQSIAQSIPIGSLSFVYVDVRTEYDDFLLGLIAWYRTLRKGGILAGSQLTSSTTLSEQWEGNCEQNNCPATECPMGEIFQHELIRSMEVAGAVNSRLPVDSYSLTIRRAIDTLSFITHSVYLVTYNEPAWSGKDSLPAWYFHKLIH